MSDKLTQQDVMNIVWPWANDPKIERAFVTEWDLRDDEDLMSLGIEEGCQYDDRKGNNCAIGVCLKGRIDPTHPVWRLQGSITAMNEQYPDVVEEVFLLDGRAMLQFLSEVQTAHDSVNTDEIGDEVSADEFDLEQWRKQLPERLRTVAERYGLTVPA